jgi:hypothetical protein
VGGVFRLQLIETVQSHFPDKPNDASPFMHSPEQWEGFLGHIENHANIGFACEATGIGRTTFYEKKANDPEFAKAYQEAMENALDKLEKAAWERAVDGVVERTITRDGTTIENRKYSDGLLTFLLKAHRPQKFKDRTTHEHTGPDGQPLAPSVVVVPALDPKQSE